MFENAAREDFLESRHLGRMQHTTLLGSLPPFAAPAHQTGTETGGQGRLSGTFRTFAADAQKSGLAKVQQTVVYGSTQTRSRMHLRQSVLGNCKAKGFARFVARSKRMTPRGVPSEARTTARWLAI
ncbi:hypothetical protein TRIHO_16880 [Tritonibacter horizontis]|uniref:Uncharacterized protein n=1 Tax=Tritonibacter horizontis TaxID=1768241 RepID=A0A132BYK8_9RHOB|nr:hypothetical protein TRIHO_16880 [Tritonibacter horizontis]